MRSAQFSLLCRRPSVVSNASFVTASLHSSRASAATSSSNSARWGDWEKPKEDENVDRMNYYDSKKFMGARRGATIICREKPVVKSFLEKTIDYFKPKREVGDSYIDTQQLLKVFSYLIVPVLFMIWWKGSYEKYPDYWEMQANQLQSKPLNEEGGKQKYSYFDVIGSLEEKREKAMARKGYEKEQPKKPEQSTN